MAQMCFRWFRIALCLFGSPLLVAAQSTPNPVEAITSALRAGQFAEAAQLAEVELQRKPGDARLWTLDGIALASKGDKRQALAAFRKALAISPDYLAALEGAAQIEYANGSKDAVPLLQHVLQLRPNDLTSQAMLAVMAYRRGDCATAVAHFERSDTLLDSQPGALQQYGDCLMRLKQTDQAIEIFNRALMQSGDDSTIRSRLATAQLIARRPKDAIATLQPLLEKNTSDPDVLDLMASAYEADENTPEAVRILRQAIVSHPHDVDLYVDFANLSLDHQSYQVGVDMMNAGIGIEPKAAPLYVARGILYVQLAKYEEAEADFEKADALDPRRAAGSAAEGLAAVQQNDPDKALATVRAKLAKTPRDAFLLYLQADILAQRGPAPGSAEFKEAMESAKKATLLQPSLAAARDLLAKLYIQSGQNDAAIAQCRKALSSDPKDQTALYHLIQALRKSGKTDELPNLLKQLAEMRAESTKKEAEHLRYKLVEGQPSTPETQQP